ncbi:hypothetical protein PPSIR1_09271 [Plesiocystis pacifica SIR-1]|uniref:STAS/SEC14 domain-containing protein n=1 Tax=Plesiocystis pacifica SIR-1 TaxID=391625 RepID=A6GIK1_9BACT|nr:hypothetical protein [Plesiocystis pacifica]EDM74287.1 hypothetical protein PPSIR1_09271 [Plesiocystis pacifica SIR-1]
MEDGHFESDKFSVRWADGGDVLLLEVHTPYEAKDVWGMTEQLQRFLDDDEPPRLLLIDHAGAPNLMPRDVRKELEKTTDRMPVEFFVVTGLNNLNRMVGRIIARVFRPGQVNFFDTPAEGIEWLRGQAANFKAELEAKGTP